MPDHIQRDLYTRLQQRGASMNRPSRKYEAHVWVADYYTVDIEAQDMSEAFAKAKGLTMEDVIERGYPTGEHHTNLQYVQLLEEQQS